MGPNSNLPVQRSHSPKLLALVSQLASGAEPQVRGQCFVSLVPLGTTFRTLGRWFQAATDAIGHSGGAVCWWLAIVS